MRVIVCRLAPRVPDEFAVVAELADAQDLGSCVRKDVWVRVPPTAVASIAGEPLGAPSLPAGKGGRRAP